MNLIQSIFNLLLYSSNIHFFKKNTWQNFLSRLCGSYEDLQIGQVSEALVDFTGGVNMTIKLAEAPPDLWDILTRATYSRSLMGCQTDAGVRPSFPFSQIIIKNFDLTVPCMSFIEAGETFPPISCPTNSIM